jgi:hypothetical protein
MTGERTSGGADRSAPNGHVFTFTPANSGYRKMLKAIHRLTWPSDKRKPGGGVLTTITPAWIRTKFSIT